MVHHPMVYADLLRRKVERYGVGCWLVNTGWIGGPFGVGKRIGIGYTRTLLNAALDGSLDDVPFRRDTVFGFEVPQACEGVPAEILNPSGTWPSQEGYRDKYRQLAARFVENFKKFESECPPEVIAAGPRMT
jgi:phosphoenolpyruvate carboxykinase (ATP)